MEQEPKKSNKVYLIIIVILTIALIGTSGYLLYDKILANQESNDKKSQNNQVEKDDVKENIQTIKFEQATVDEQLNKYLTPFLNYRVVGIPNHFNQDLFTDANLRGEFINSIFMHEKACTWFDNGIMETFPYVKKDEYINMYLEVYGKADLFEYDLANGNVFWTSDNYEQYLGSKDYILWNGTWGASATQFTLHADKIIYQEEEKKYTMSGNYQMTNISDSTSKNGTFTLIYVKDEYEQNHIQSLTIFE